MQGEGEDREKKTARRERERGTKGLCVREEGKERSILAMAEDDRKKQMNRVGKKNEGIWERKWEDKLYGERRKNKRKDRMRNKCRGRRGKKRNGKRRKRRERSRRS